MWTPLLCGWYLTGHLTAIIVQLISLICILYTRYRTYNYCVEPQKRSYIRKRKFILYYFVCCAGIWTLNPWMIEVADKSVCRLIHSAMKNRSFKVFTVVLLSLTNLDQKFFWGHDETTSLTNVLSSSLKVK
jgi:hypothetical protein